jgi:hypothetical protein
MVKVILTEFTAWSIFTLVLIGLGFLINSLI